MDIGALPLDHHPDVATLCRLLSGVRSSGIISVCSLGRFRGLGAKGLALGYATRI